MDPSIMKLLEEDKDESMHSGADMDAFQAALNRDIGGDASTSRAPQSDRDLDQLGSHIANQAFPGFQSTNNQDEMKNSQLQQEQRHMQHQERMQSETELKQHGEAKDPNQKDIHQEVNHLLLHQRQSQDDLQSGQDGDSQYLKLQKMSNQQAMLPDQNRSNRVKQVPFARLLPVISPQLDKDRAMLLQTLYVKLKNNVIPKEGFVRIMRGIVGDQMLKLAVMKIQQSGSNQFHMQGEASAPQSHPRMQSAAPAKFNESQSFPQLHQKGNSETSHSVSSLVHDRDHTSAPVQGLNRQQQQQQQHLQNMQATFPMYGSGVPYHTFSGTHVTSNASSGKSQSQDFQMKQVPSHQSMGSNQPGSMGQAMNTGMAPKFERSNSIGDSKRMMNGSISAFMNNNPSMQQGSIPWRPPITKEQTSGPFSSMGYVKPEPVDHSNDQQHKSQLTAPHSLSSVSAEQSNHKFPPLAGNSRDGSLDPQSPGVGFLPAKSAAPSHSESTSMSTEDPNVQVGSRTSLSTTGTNSRTPTKKISAGQKKPLEAPGSSPPPSSKKQKVSGNFADQSIEQLIDVTAVSGVNLREEEKQLFSGPKEDSRVSEAPRRVVQEEEEASILQKDPLQKRLAEIMVKCGVKTLSNDVERCLSLCVEERMRGLLSNLIRFSKQPEGSNAADGDKDEDDKNGEGAKVNREEDDKMRTTAANVAARADVGDDDMLSKWQLMAEQARQKREGVPDVASGSQGSKDSGTGKATSASGRSTKDPNDSGKRVSSSGGVADAFIPQEVARKKKKSRAIAEQDDSTIATSNPSRVPGSGTPSISKSKKARFSHHEVSASQPPEGSKKKTSMSQDKRKDVAPTKAIRILDKGKKVASSKDKSQVPRGKSKSMEKSKSTDPSSISPIWKKGKETGPETAHSEVKAASGEVPKFFGRSFDFEEDLFENESFKTRSRRHHEPWDPSAALKDLQFLRGHSMKDLEVALHLMSAMVPPDDNMFLDFRPPQVESVLKEHMTLLAQVVASSKNLAHMSTVMSLKFEDLRSKRAKDLVESSDKPYTALETEVGELKEVIKDMELAARQQADEAKLSLENALKEANNAMKERDEVQVSSAAQISTIEAKIANLENQLEGARAEIASFEAKESEIRSASVKNFMESPAFSKSAQNHAKDLITGAIGRISEQLYAMDHTFPFEKVPEICNYAKYHLRKIGLVAVSSSDEDCQDSRKSDDSDSSSSSSEDGFTPDASPPQDPATHEDEVEEDVHILD